MNYHVVYATHAECIREYVFRKYQGGLIGISDLAEYCSTSEGKILVALAELQKQEEVEIIKRYFCPESHQVFLESSLYCLECAYPYSEDFISVLIYVKPLKLEYEALNRDN